MSNGRECVTVNGLKSLKTVASGTGLLSFWIGPKGRGAKSNRQFDLYNGSPIGYSFDETQASIPLDSGFKSPCSGVIAWTDDGYIIAPSVRLVTSGGGEIVLMLISPASTAHEVSIDKTTLSIPKNDAIVILSAENGEIRCNGTVSGSFKLAKLLVNRNPGSIGHREGYDQTIVETRVPGEIIGVWTPVSRVFEEHVLAFDPFNIQSSIVDDLRQSLRTSSDSTEIMSDYVVGDAANVRYTIRLLIDRGLGRHESDETRVVVSR